MGLLKLSLSEAFAGEEDPGVNHIKFLTWP